MSKLSTSISASGTESTQASNFILSSTYGTTALHLLPLLYVAFVLAIVPIGRIWGLDTDEGNNVIKSWLYADGYKLYREIWSDQPPLFTVILTGWWKLWGMSMASARGLVLGFSALLLWCFGQVVRRSMGLLPALIGMLILMNTRYFVKLSASAMIGLPAIALALLSLYFLSCSTNHRLAIALPIASGFCFACSLQTKLFTLFLFPLMGLALLFPQFLGFAPEIPHQTGKPQRGLRLSLWLISLGATHLTLGFIFQTFTAQQILAPHTTARIAAEYQTSSFYSIRYLLSNTFGHDYLFYGLALVGGVSLVLQRRALFPLLWLLTALLLLANHLPVWYHHGLLLSVPLAWLGAGAVKTALDSHQRLVSGLVILLLLGSLILEPLHFWPQRAHYFQKIEQQAPQTQVVNLLRRYQGQTRWLVSDDPLYAFHAGLKVPPALAVPSLKRFHTGQLTATDLLNLVQEYEPEQILLSKFRFMADQPGMLHDYIQQHYQQTYEDHELGIVCWVRNSL